MFVYVAECNLIISIFSPLAWKHDTVIIWPLPSRITMGQMFMFKAVVCAQDTHIHCVACGTFPKARLVHGPNVDISGVFCAHTHTHTMSNTHTGSDQTDAI